jgi:hypothetical protein
MGTGQKAYPDKAEEEEEEEEEEEGVRKLLPRIFLHAYVGRGLLSTSWDTRRESGVPVILKAGDSAPHFVMS